MEHFWPLLAERPSQTQEDATAHLIADFSSVQALYCSALNRTKGIYQEEHATVIAEVNTSVSELHVTTTLVLGHEYY